MSITTKIGLHSRPAHWHPWAISGSLPPGQKKNYWDVGYADGDALVFGNEGHGAPEWLHEELAATRVTIPQKNPEMRSLNLSTAAGIATYEALRQMR